MKENIIYWKKKQTMCRCNENMKLKSMQFIMCGKWFFLLRINGEMRVTAQSESWKERIGSIEVSLFNREMSLSNIRKILYTSCRLKHHLNKYGSNSKDWADMMHLNPQTDCILVDFPLKAVESRFIGSPNRIYSKWLYNESEVFSSLLHSSEKSINMLNQCSFNFREVSIKMLEHGF